MSARDSSIRYVWRRCACLIPAAVLACSADVSAQEGGGIIRGTVSLAQTSEPIHGATVLLSELRRTVTTDENGHYEIKNVPPGSYELLALREHLTTERKAVTVIADQPMTVDFSLAIGVHEELTVTANPTGETTVFEAFSTIRSLDSVELTENRGATLTDALETIPGVSKRSFGPGSARPIIRGFDGDRVLIMQDGVRTGDLSSQSADHGVTIDPAGLHRLEVVKGPATLLYGSNAIGGVVNAITPQEAFRSNPFSGVFGQASADLGSANLQAGGGGNVQVGRGPGSFGPVAPRAGPAITTHLKARSRTPPRGWHTAPAESDGPAAAPSSASARRSRTADTAFRSRASFTITKKRKKERKKPKSTAWMWTSRQRGRTTASTPAFATCKAL
jgi:hypothetical protein